MLLLTNLTAQTILPGQSVTFDDVNIKAGCSACFRKPSISAKLLSKGIYDISYTANIGSATAGGAAQLAVQLGGTTLPGGTLISVSAAANDLNNVSVSTAAANCCCDFDRVTVTNNGTTPVLLGANSALLIERRS